MVEAIKTVVSNLVHPDIVRSLELEIEAFMHKPVQKTQAQRSLAKNLAKMVRTYHHECSGDNEAKNQIIGPSTVVLGSSGGLGTYGWGDLEFVDQFTQTQLFA